MDFITHLPTTINAGYDSIFTIVDRLSKYVVFVPCVLTASAMDVAQLFCDNFVTKFGMPKTIVSDRDSKFLSAFWQSLLTLLDCKSALSSAYHP